MARSTRRPVTAKVYLGLGAMVDELSGKIS